MPPLHIGSVRSDSQIPRAQALLLTRVTSQNPRMPSGRAARAKPFNSQDTPAYPLTEAARYLKLPAATLRAWVIGRPYPRGKGVAHFEPLIRPPSTRPPLLSFWNLVEAHILRSLRTEHGISLGDLREALRYAERNLEIERLLLDQRLCTDAGKLFIDRYGQLINLSASGQLAMRKVFDEHLKRIEWADVTFPIRLYPFIASSADTTDRSIVIDPAIAFGRPIVVSAGVTTQAIADRVDAGEAVDEIANDYGLATNDIEQAVVYERAA
jgi:uncharacterized protein (DUF433 family)